jgi:hypothetical protein
MSCRAAARRAKPRAGAQLVLRVQQALAEPIEVESLACRWGPRSAWPCCPDDGSEADALLHHADLAMYAHKRQPRRPRRPSCARGRPGSTQLEGQFAHRLAVSRATALAKAGASGGRPGSPMPVGASSLGTVCTAICGMAVMRGTAKSPKLLCSTRRP